MTTTSGQLLRAGGQKLKAAGSKSAWLDAALIIGFVMHKTKEHLLTHPEQTITATQRATVKKLIARRARGCPVAYLTGQKEFYGLDFFVDKNVLIPRPKTERLIDQALALIASDSKNKKVNVADIGTGSGCIAVTLTKRAPNARIFAVDVSAGALSVAKRNARTHGVTKKIKFYRGDLLAPLRNKQLDIIIANLPYLRPEQIRGAIRFEPRRALVGGRDGLFFLNKLFQQISRLKPLPRFVVLEVDAGQKKDLLRLTKKHQLAGVIIDVF